MASMKTPNKMPTNTHTAISPPSSDSRGTRKCPWVGYVGLSILRYLCLSQMVLRGRGSTTHIEFKSMKTQIVPHDEATYR